MITFNKCEECIHEKVCKDLETYNDIKKTTSNTEYANNSIFHIHISCVNFWAKPVNGCLTGGVAIPRGGTK